MVNRSLDQIGIIPCCLILIVPVPRRGAQLRIFPIRTAAKQAVACTRKLCTADLRAACGTPLPRLEDGLLFPRGGQRRERFAARLRACQRIQHTAQLSPADRG